MTHSREEFSRGGSEPECHKHRVLEGGSGGIHFPRKILNGRNQVQSGSEKMQVDSTRLFLNAQLSALAEMTLESCPGQPWKLFSAHGSPSTSRCNFLNMLDAVTRLLETGSRLLVGLQNSKTDYTRSSCSDSKTYIIPPDHVAQS